MRSVSKPVRIDSGEIAFKVDDDSKSVVEYKGNTYRGIPQLLEAIPALKEKEHLLELSKVINFLAKGWQFSIIENITEAKDLYHRRLEAEKDEPLQRGEFDWTKVSLPKYEGEKAIFFATDDTTGVPYEVNVFLQRNPIEVAYNLLPYQGRNE